MDDATILGGTLGQLGQAVKKAGQQIVKIPEEMTVDLGGQVAGVKQSDGDKVQENKSGKQWQSDGERIKFLRDLYSFSEKNPSEVKKDDLQTSQDKKPTEFQEQIADKSPEEQKKLMELRNQLHKENYYDPTFNPVKKPPDGGEERPAEKIENEKKQEMQELEQKEAKKPPPLAVVRERNKAEMFRGAAG